MPLFNQIPTQFEATITDGAMIVGQEPNGAAAIGLIVDTSTAYTVAGAKLLSVRNAGSEIVYFDKYGNARFGEIYVGYGPFYLDTYPPWLVGSTYSLDDEVVYQYRHYRSLQNANTGNTPPPAPTSNAWWEYFPLTNTVVGANAFTNNSTSINNIAIGPNALRDTYTGSHNLAIGPNAMMRSITGNSNVAIGVNALSSLYGAATHIAIGQDTLKDLGAVVAAANIVTGVTYRIMTVGTTNWMDAGAYSNTVGSAFTSIVDGTTGDGTAYADPYDCIAIGYGAQRFNVGGMFNISIGTGTLQNNLNASGNIGIGSAVMSSGTFDGTYTGAVGIGNRVLVMSTVLTEMVGIGDNVLSSNSTGYGHTAVGYQALMYNETGSNNSAFGKYALMMNVVGKDMVAVGANALINSGSEVVDAVNINNGTYIISFVGTTDFTLGGAASNTIGVQFTWNGTPLTGDGTAYRTIEGTVAIGSGAMQGTADSLNTAVGGRAMELHRSGKNNVAIGYQAFAADLYSDTAVAVGVSTLQSLGLNTIATQLVANLWYIITDAGNTDWTLVGAANNNVGTQFTATGPGAGTGLAAGVTNTNTAIGNLAGATLVNGRHNTYLGAYSGSGQSYGNDSVYLGYSTTSWAGGSGTAFNEIVIGWEVEGHGTNTATLGKLTTTTATYLYGTLYVDDVVVPTRSGTAELDFGAAPGTNRVSIAVTGQTGITAGAVPRAWINFDSTASHNTEEHLLLNQFASVVAGDVIAGTGFTIYAVIPYLRINGTLQVRWSY